MSGIDVKDFEKFQPKITKSGRSRSDSARYAIRRGKAGEHYIVKLLTGISGVPWLRIPNSGARLGMTNRDRVFYYTEEQIESMLGDIFPPHQLHYRFIIESKNYGAISFKKLEKGEAPSKLTGWIYEINFDTETYLMYREKARHPLRVPLAFLVFKIKNQGTWITYNKSYFERMGITKFNPTYTIEYNETTDRLKDIGYESTWHIEDFKAFVISNKDIMFKRSEIYNEMLKKEEALRQTI